MNTIRLLVSELWLIHKANDRREREGLLGFGVKQAEWDFYEECRSVLGERCPPPFTGPHQLEVVTPPDLPPDVLPSVHEAVEEYREWYRRLGDMEAASLGRERP